MNGVINFNKPAGISSAKAVALVKRLLPRGTKIGHAGSLDPAASGVLLLLVGPAVKSCERMMNQPKRYEATIKLGATTVSDDVETPEIPTAGAQPPTPQRISHALAAMTGVIPQRPPAYSAIKIGGRRACDWVRMGKSVELPARNVRIDAIEWVDWQWPMLRLRIDCGRGTYIRAIARDLGAALGVGGYLCTLVRTRVGDFELSQCLSLEQLQQGDLGDLAGSIQPIQPDLGPK